MARLYVDFGLVKTVYFEWKIIVGKFSNERNS